MSIDPSPISVIIASPSQRLPALAVLLFCRSDYTRGVAKVKILGGCRDLVLPTDLIMVTDIGEGSKGRGVPLLFGPFYDIQVTLDAIWCYIYPL